MTTSRTALLATATTLVLWASAFVGIRIALPGLGYAGLSAGRLLVASLALVPVAVAMRVPRPRRADLARIAGCGLTGMTAYQLLLNTGERTVPSGTASLLVGTAPIFAALFAFVLLSERLTGRVRVGIAVAFGGAVVMSVAQGAGFVPSHDALLVLGAAAMQALFFVLQKPLLARYRAIDVTCWAMWVGTVFALPLLPEAINRVGSASSAAVGALIFLGVAPSAIGFVTWAYAQARVPVSTAANSLYLVPAIAIGVAWLVRGESVRPAAVIGGVLALAGVAISRSSTRPRPRAPRPTPPDPRARPARSSCTAAPRAGG